MGLLVMLVAIGVALALVILFPTAFGYPRPSGAGIGLFGFFGGFFVIFLFVLIVLWIVRIGMWSSRSARGYYRRGGGPEGRYGALAIARQRYARGEISREQYQQIVADLRQGPGAPPPQ